MALSLEGKSVIVSGADAGIGRAIARRFLDAGARVMLAGADEAELVAVVDQSGAGSELAQHFVCDLRERLAVINLVSATVDAFDRVDVLVNARRELIAGDPLDPATDGIAQLLEANVVTAVRLIQACARRMIQQRKGDADSPGGAIVNTTATAALRTVPMLTGYAISSAALDQVTSSMALALAPHRIRVNAVALGAAPGERRRVGRDAEDEAEPDLVSLPVRPEETAEAAEIALMLASDSSAATTGQVLAVGARGEPTPN